MDYFPNFTAGNRSGVTDRMAIPGAPTPPQTYRCGLHAQSLAGDTKWLLAALRNRMRPATEGVRDYVTSFHRSTRCFSWRGMIQAWDDPKPAVRNLVGRFWRRES